VISFWVLIAVGIGAALGAWLRLGLSIWLNHTHPSLPVGTLTANVLGGLLIGLSVGLLDRWPELDPAWRTVILTGFLGALTTFSTFSLEALTLLSRGQYGWLVGHSALHLFGSMAAAAIGLRLTNA